LFVLCADTIVAEEVSRGSSSGLLDTAGVTGGLVVCIGCDDLDLLASLRANESYVVHGLDTDADKLAKARRSLLEKGLYGPVSVQQWDGETLPYVDNLVNLVVASGEWQVANDEISRVLAPGGVALAFDSRLSTLDSFRKPWSDEIDEWTHYLHGPDNNALAEDSLVGPPRHIQWRSEPMWGRHHHAEKGTQPTVRTVVSSRGRLFFLVDETKSSDMKVSSKWTIVARDAFSGVLLWKRPVAVQQYPRRLEQVWRQLIAHGDRLYAVLGDGQPLSELNAIDGSVTRNYQGSEGLKEVIKEGNRLLVLCGDDSIVAFEADTASELWTWAPGEDGAVTPGTLAASDGKMFVKTGKALHCLAADTGQALWRVSLPGPEAKSKLPFPHEKLLVKDDVVLCSYAGKDPASLRRDIAEYLGSHPRVREYGGKLGAFSARDGERLWETVYLPNLESAPGEIYVHDGQVWLGPDFAEPRDLRTGTIRETRPVIERLWTDGHHYRCYPGKATSRYIITAKRGIELIDMAGDDHSRNNWVRATCRVGFTPCNGLLYAPPHSCGCYMEAKLFGFWALASRRTLTGTQAKQAKERLEKGPAFGASDLQPTAYSLQPPAWPTYRGNEARTGCTSMRVAAELKPAWKTELGGRLSAATVADNKVFVAQVDAHRVHALDMNTGDKLWSFTAGGRVDSPPTICRFVVPPSGGSSKPGNNTGRVQKPPKGGTTNGLCLFGSADGYVYCLRASDGEMVWRFLAAPRHLNTVAFDQPESVWPVHGSVLFHRGIVYAAAGRSSYLDGGIMMYGLDPASGKVLAERHIESEHVGATDPPEDAGKYASKIRQNWLDYKTTLAPDRSDSFAMQGATTDILVADGESVYLRRMRFDGDLVEQKAKRPHLFSTSGLLDDWEHNRSYWVLGTGDFYGTPVAYPWILRKDIKVPFGLMIAFDEKTVWGVHRAKGYQVFAMPRPDPELKESALPDFKTRTSTKKAASANWTASLGIRPRAMLRAGDLLFFGGRSADHTDNSSSAAPARTDSVRGYLQVVSCVDGKTVREMGLASSPVWDGMAAAQGRLFVPCVDGTLVCLASK